MNREPAAESAAPGFAASLRGSLDTLLGLLQNRLGLLGVEISEERTRFLATLAYGAVAVIALGAGLVFLAIFITVLLWDSHRLLVLGVFAAMFLGGGVLALKLAAGYARRPSSLFSASLAELSKDRAAVNSSSSVSPSREST